MGSSAWCGGACANTGWRGGDANPRQFRQRAQIALARSWAAGVDSRRPVRRAASGPARCLFTQGTRDLRDHGARSCVRSAQRAGAADMSNTTRQSDDNVLVHEHARFELTEFAQVCGTTTAFIEELMLEGVLQPRNPPGTGDFGATEILRVRRVLRLQHTFEAPLPSVAVMVELLD